MALQGPVRKILLYVDGSEECITAAQYAVVMAKRTGADLIAIYVVNASVLEELLKARIFIKMEQMDYEHNLEQDGKKYLHYISKLAASKNVPLETILVKGVVNSEVVRKVDELGVDLLVMGELNPIRYRSETFHDEGELIFRNSKCSVLIVKDSSLVERLYESLE